MMSRFQVLLLVVSVFASQRSFASIHDELFEASAAGDFKRVESLIEAGADVNYIQTKSSTMLEWDPTLFPETFEYLGNSYSNKNIYDKFLSQLETLHIQINTTDSKKSVTFSGHYVDIVLPLLRGWSFQVSPPKTSHDDSESMSPRSTGSVADRSVGAWEEGGLKTLADGSQEMRLSCKVEVKHRDESPTPLMMASFGGHIRVVQLLLKNGAKVNYKWEGRAPSALMYACAGGHEEVVKELLAAGASQEVNYVDHTGSTALSIALSRKDSKIANILTAAGASDEVSQK